MKPWLESPTVQVRYPPRMIGSSSDTNSLAAGQFFGRTVRTRRVPGTSLAEIHYPPGLSIRRHDHELASLCFVLAGTYDERYGYQRRTCRQGAVILHPEGEHHDNAHRAAPVRLLSVEIDGARLASLREAAPVLAESADYAAGEISRLAMSLAREFWSDEATSALAIEAVVLEILVESCRRGVEQKTEAPAWLARVEEFLRAYFAKSVALSDIACAVGVHPAHLAQTFRRHHGHTIGAHIRRLRLEAARSQLGDDALSLAEIADGCGFTDQSHFTRLFRAAYGTTPAAFRRELKSR
jgi:AraC family transcriptional regulator